MQWQTHCIMETCNEVVQSQYHNLGGALPSVKLFGKEQGWSGS